MTNSSGSSTGRRHLPARASLAVGALSMVNRLSRALDRGSGTVAGGRVGLAIDPRLLALLTAGRRVALVSGTNGKTTTTKMLTAALSGPGEPPVASNVTGANMPAGQVAALVGARDTAMCVLEVDEGYLGRVIDDTRPRVVVLLNLSRDQLDRIAEVRMLVDRWRAALSTVPTTGTGQGTTVVANADDPMVAWAASAAPEVVWVGAGQVWRHDAVGCPACGGRIEFAEDGGWACDRCAFRRPLRDAWLEGTTLVLAGGTRVAVDIVLPGQFNRANAAMAALAAPIMTAGGGTRGGPEQITTETRTSGRALTAREALARIASVDEVAGRFASTTHDGRPVRLLLAKNPAGWTAIFDLLDETSPLERPVVLSINARIADGLDPSWLWDVPFERLSGRTVVVTGDRRRDLAVRLRYAEVAATVIDDPVAAVERALAAGVPVSTPVARAADGGLPATAGAPTTGPPPPSVEFLGNYTAFAELRGRL